MSAALGSRDGTYGGLPSSSRHQYSWKGLVIQSGSRPPAVTTISGGWGEVPVMMMSQREKHSLVWKETIGERWPSDCVAPRHDSWPRVTITAATRPLGSALKRGTDCKGCFTKAPVPPAASTSCDLLTPADTMTHATTLKSAAKVCWRHSSQAWLLGSWMSLILIDACNPNTWCGEFWERAIIVLLHYECMLEIKH